MHEQFSTDIWPFRAMEKGAPILIKLCQVVLSMIVIESSICVKRPCQLYQPLDLEQFVAQKSQRSWPAPPLWLHVVAPKPFMVEGLRDLHLPIQMWRWWQW